MRSQLERRFAESCDRHAVPWRYETWRNGSERGERRYWPDFTLPECVVLGAFNENVEWTIEYLGPLVVEIKPTWEHAVDALGRLLDVLKAGLRLPSFAVANDHSRLKPGPPFPHPNAIGWMPPYSFGLEDPDAVVAWAAAFRFKPGQALLYVVGGDTPRPEGIE